MPKEEKESSKEDQAAKARNKERAGLALAVRFPVVLDAVLPAPGLDDSVFAQDGVPVDAAALLTLVANFVV
jgi:hypothetical protein